MYIQKLKINPKKSKRIGNQNLVVMHAFEELLRTPLEFGFWILKLQIGVAKA
jgi:hypothetical protein